MTSHSKTDSFGRKVFDELQLGTGFVSRQFSYHAGTVTQEHIDAAKLKSTATTQLVSQIVLSDGRTLAYEYDAEERITRVTDSVDGVTEYVYDAQGQLLSETRNGEAVNAMTYDGYGNILTKNGKAYTYGDTVWKDRLTAYDGQAITYDAQGNPTSYLGHTLAWEKGRQLKSFDGIQYTYNANGIRTSKTVNGVAHTYTLDGTKILRETWGGNTLVPLYDNEDSVCGVIYNGEPFYFFKNLQGDIIAIADKNAQVVAKYSYDAWGVCTVEQDASTVGIARVNPFRYRGYYFDAEIGMYYLQSRYYDPAVGRFVNADEAGFLSTSNTIVNHNIFSYCENNPINDLDLSGSISLKSILSTIKGFINKLIDSIWNYINGLFKWDKVSGTISVSTTVISIAIDALIAGITNSLIYKGLKAGMRFLLQNNSIRSSFINGMLDFFLNNTLGKTLLWLIFKIGLSIAGKASVLGTITGGVFEGYLSNILSFKSKLLERAGSLISAFSSIGGVIALLLDFSDKSWDDYLTIKYSKGNSFSCC